ncbi:Planctomycete cytochrome C [Stieleria maiorica]|uniref:Planctomycete cytochrome C n=2 Tax=Stieleria maiorica TaxID=2795974 RepID=A0A5B9M6S2_9BACT|nr:Planctomycete cytochrome C [Stieleria maiorica]
MLCSIVSRREVSRTGLVASSTTIAFAVLVSLASGTARAAEKTASVFVNQYCVDCHSGEESEAGLRMDTLKLKLGDQTAFDAWAMIHHRVSNGEMPPEDGAQPELDERAEWLAELGNALADADRDRQERFGRSELRRLSRVEFANSLKDILDLPYLEVEEMLPPDSLAHGYSKSAMALDFSHVMVTRYMEAADEALWQALASHVESYPSEIIRAELKSIDGVSDTLQTLRVQLKQTTAMPLIGMRRDPTLEVTKGNFAKRDPGTIRDPEPHFDGVATFMNSRSNHNIVVKPFKVKQSGYYKIRVHGWGLLNDHGELQPSDRTEAVAFYSASGRLLGRCDLPPNEPTTSEITAWLNAEEPIEYLAISTDNELFNFPDRGKAKYETFKAHGIGLQWFEMEGPLAGPRSSNEGGAAQWPPESHRLLLGDLELEPTDLQPNGLAYRVVTEEPIADARRLLGRFVRHAYRRPQNEGDLRIPMQMVRRRLQRGEPFVDALMAGYRAVLTSPDFLLLSEHPGRLDAWALASRLSFFLWNSPPDWELRRAAASGELLSDDELQRQTQRMLRHPKSSRFVEHFLDDWLDLRNITLTEPDKNLYPEYNALLTESMVEETRAFFTEMIDGDLGANHVFKSDFLTINQRMAQLYGVEGVQGFHTRKVSLEEGSVRGGLLTQGSLLKLTANGTTTSPVVRGTFILSRLLGDPPPPPPASVPAIEPDISGATTIREQLAKHRSIAMCASCHQKIDPPGFALESFDVMGAWRTSYRALAEKGDGIDLKSNGKPVSYKIGQPVDSAGQLPDGSSFEDINQFRVLLESREPQIARNLLEQLIVYATGTPVGFADQRVVDEMMESLAKKRYGLRAMIYQIVLSDLFRSK